MPAHFQLSAALILIALTTAPPSLAAQADDRTNARGYAFARLHCSRCHSIGKAGDSLNPKAPPLRTISPNYPYRILREGLERGVVVSHDPTSMPAFRLTPQAISDIIAYMRSVAPR